MDDGRAGRGSGDGYGGSDRFSVSLSDSTDAIS
jgi:hypothetical protein